MNWFKNLNAMPRLMSSFGILLAFTVGISYLAIINLSQANTRAQEMYQLDMKGAVAIGNIAVDRMSVGRQSRDALIDIDNPSAVANDKRSIESSFADVRSNLQVTDLTIYSKEGKEQIAIIREILPQYERSLDGILGAIDAKDAARAKTLLAELEPLSQRWSVAINKTLEIKEAHAEGKYEDNNKAYQSTRSLVITATAISLAVGIILSIFISRMFSVPLGQTVSVLEKVADGDLTASLDVDTKDEVGRMANALNRAVEKLNHTLQEVAASASNASSSSQQLAAASEAISSGAQQQAASLEETSASLEEITAAVRQSADNANQASQLAAGSKDSALQGQGVVSDAITAMAEINAASAKISDIISTIDEIAFQTNLLAVNAAVEAARAGEEGRGFAVVASEVRSLAQRSAVAAKEIKGLIQDSLRKVEAGSALVNRSGETLQGIVNSVKRVTDIVGEIAATSAEQSAGIDQVNTAMTQMDQVTQSNSAQTEELSATAQSLSEQSAHLLELVNTFTLSQGGTNGRDRHFFQPREAGSSHSFGTGLVQSVKASALHPALHADSAPQSGKAPQRQARAARSTSAKSESRPRAAKSAASRPPALAAAAVVASGSADASFEEF